MVTVRVSLSVACLVMREGASVLRRLATVGSDVTDKLPALVENITGVLVTTAPEALRTVS